MGLLAYCSTTFCDRDDRGYGLPEADAVERFVGKLDDHQLCLAQRDDALDVVRRADARDLGSEGHRRGLPLPAAT